MENASEEGKGKANKRKKNEENFNREASEKDDKKWTPAVFYDWSQNDREVTLILQINKEVENNDISVDCESKSCRVRIKGRLVWHCDFYEPVNANKFMYNYNGNELHLILSKLNQKHWTQFQATDGCLTVDEKNGCIVKNDLSEEQPLHQVAQLKYSTYERPGLLSFSIYVKDIRQESLKVIFEEKSLTVIFQTRDSKFLALQSCINKNTKFLWNIELRGSIIPSECRYNLTATRLEIIVGKKGQWVWDNAVTHNRTLPAVKPLMNSNKKNVLSPTVQLDKWVPAVSSNESASDNSQTNKLNNSKSEVSSPCDNKKAELSATSEASKCLPVKEVIKKPTCAVSPLNKSKFSEQTCMVGLTGLENLGNTCFMNSVIQSLVNTREFRDYFMEKQFQKEINAENAFGTGGKLAVSFAMICRVLWSGNQRSYAPSNLKSLIALKASQFTGFAQHDAQEFMAFLLDGLHEDLNRVKNRPQIENKESCRRADEIVADEAWELYKRRNDSIVVDLFQGQFKSKLVCPICKKVSITFDPFLYLSVPVPSKLCTIPIIYFAKDPSRRPCKYVIQLPQEATVEQLKEKISVYTSVSPKNLKIFEVYKNKLHKWFASGSNLLTVSPTDVIFCFEILGEDLAKEAVVQISVIQRIVMPQPLTRCSFCKRECHNSGSKLKRCTKCYRASYCDQNCQKNHWSNHKSSCRATPEPVGSPFIVSLPKSQATYGKLCQMMGAFARYSVDVFQPPLDTSETLGQHQRTSLSSATTTCYEDALYQSPTKDSPYEFGSWNSLSESCEFLGKSCGPDGDSDSSSLDTMPGMEGNGLASSTKAVFSLSPKVASEYAIHHFSIQPVNASGVDIAGIFGEKFQDKGDEPLDFISNNCYLAMDWNNNEKSKNYVLVQSKELDFDEENKEENLKVQSNTSLENCLKLFAEPEVLSSEEAWYCPECKEHREATKELSLWRLPSVLIIQLKRFSFKNFIFRDKIDRFIEFPIRGLDLSKWCGNLMQSSSEDPNVLYDLYAVINHHGSILGGHYTACGRLLDKMATNRTEVDWRLFDDNRVSFIPESSVVTKAAYVLFYRRRGAPFQPHGEVVEDTHDFDSVD